MKIFELMAFFFTNHTEENVDEYNFFFYYDESIFQNNDNFFKAPNIFFFRKGIYNKWNG